MTCETNDIEHRLTKPNHPWTNGQVERMNRTSKEATVKRFQLRKSEQREAAIAYHQAVLAGRHDVDDALTAYAEAQQGEVAARTRLSADQRALAAAEHRRNQGIAAMLDVVTEQQAVYRAKDDVAGAQGQVEIALVTLYKALGGGCEIGSSRRTCSFSNVISDFGAKQGVYQPDS